MEKTKLIKLNQWVLDPVNNTLYAADNSNKKLEAKFVLLLVFLAKNHRQVVTREQLKQSVWGNRYVDYNTISATISRLRKILGGGRDDFIKTHPKLGYSLTCQLSYQDYNSEFIAQIPEQVSLPETSIDDNPVEDSSQRAAQEIAPQEISHQEISHQEISIQENLKADEVLIQQEQSIAPTTKLPVKKRYTLLVLVFLILSLSLLLFQQETKIQPLLTEQEASLEPLTYMEGWELSARLSFDKSLMVFVHKASHDTNNNVIIQNINNKQTIILEPDNQTHSPFWSAQSNALFYKSITNNQCTIKKVLVQKAFTLSTAEHVTSCGLAFSGHAIAISSDLNWLYYTEKLSKLSPRVVKRYNLKNFQTETLTAPPGKYRGDGNISLSGDNTKLAFIRYYDDDSEELMLLNLHTGETKSLLKNQHLANSTSWTLSDSHVFFIDEKKKTLNAISITTGTITPLYQYNDRAENPVMISNTEILLTLGDLYTVDIKKLDLNAPQETLTTLISTSFKDHSAAIFNLGDSERIVFVSDRSGNKQIWLKENNQLKQLTHFKDKPYITELSFSANGQNVLFLMDTQLYVLNITTDKLSKISLPTPLVKNFIWLCHSDENILILALENNIWQLHQININTQHSKLLSTDLTSIHGQCIKTSTEASTKVKAKVKAKVSTKVSTGNKSSQYYASSITSKGLFQLTDNWEIDGSYHYFTDVLLTYNQEWGVNSQAIYRISDEGEVYQFDFATGQQTLINIDDVTAYYLSIQNNYLLLNNQKFADPYVGKITIPDLNNRLIK